MKNQSKIAELLTVAWLCVPLFLFLIFWLNPLVSFLSVIITLIGISFVTRNILTQKSNDNFTLSVKLIFVLFFPHAQLPLRRELEVLDFRQVITQSIMRHFPILLAIVGPLSMLKIARLRTILAIIYPRPQWENSTRT